MSAKDEVDGSDVSKMIYSFGPRFFVEVKKRLDVYLLCLTSRLLYLVLCFDMIHLNRFSPPFSTILLYRWARNSW